MEIQNSNEIVEIDREISTSLPLYTYQIEDNQDGSYRDFIATFQQRGWLSVDKKYKSKFEKRRLSSKSSSLSSFRSLTMTQTSFSKIH
jgi:hypothetical protein